MARRHAPWGKTLRSGAALVSAGALMSVGALGVVRAMAATVTLPILVNVIKSIEVTINTSLNFGTVAITNPDVVGAVRLDPSTSRLSLDGRGGLALAGGTPKAGRIRISGAPFPVNVSLAADTMQISNGVDFMTVSKFNFMTDQAGPRVTITPGGAGSSAFLNIGATLTSRTGQPTGTYTGANTIYANYQ